MSKKEGPKGSVMQQGQNLAVCSGDDGASVAIIGGGIAGLIAAIDLGRAGLKPVLFEATSTLGGRARSRRVEGYSINQGPHALYVAGTLYETLREFGIEINGSGPDLSKGFGLWGGELHAFPRLGSTKPTPPLNGHDATALSAFCLRITANERFENGRSLHEATRELPQRARQVVEALVRLTSYVDGPAEIEANAALDQLRLSFGGAIYVDGGWSSIVDGLADAALAAGALIRPKHRVTEVRACEGGWRIDSSSKPAEVFDGVILAVPPSTVARLLQMSGVLKAALDNTRSVHLVSLDLALRVAPSEEVNFALGINDSSYLSVHSAVASLAPPDGALVHLARYMKPGDGAYTENLAELERMADTLIPDWRTATAHQQRLSGATVAHDFPRSNQGGRRTPVVVDEMPGVFLAGDWVGDVGMLVDAAAASAREAASLAVSHIGKRRSKAHHQGSQDALKTGKLRK